MMIVPAPVIVRVEPFTVPGPEMTEKVTANPELAEALSVIGPAPRVTPESGPKVIVWPSLHHDRGGPGARPEGRSLAAVDRRDRPDADIERREAQGGGALAVERAPGSPRAGRRPRTGRCRSASPRRRRSPVTVAVNTTVSPWVATYSDEDKRGRGAEMTRRPRSGCCWLPGSRASRCRWR